MAGALHVSMLARPSQPPESTRRDNLISGSLDPPAGRAVHGSREFVCIIGLRPALPRGGQAVHDAGMDEPGVRIGDAERWAVDARLQQAVGDGQITLAEYEQRAGGVWESRTRDDLDLTTRDLPAPAAVACVVPPTPGRRPRTRRALAVMSSDELSGPVAPAQWIAAYSVLGSALIDLRRDDLPAEVRVRAVAVLGSVEVRVPRGVEVHLSGVSLMGGREMHLDPPRPGAPVVHLVSYAVMGGVVVGHGPALAAPVDGAVSLRKDSAPASKDRAPARERRHRRSYRGVLGIVALVAVMFGIDTVDTADSAAVFGSTVVHVPPGESRDVAVLFGSVMVIVPDGALVDGGGYIVFGSNDCKACDVPGSKRVTVRGRGAFGSTQIETETQYAKSRADKG